MQGFNVRGRLASAVARLCRVLSQQTRCPNCRSAVAFERIGAEAHCPHCNAEFTVTHVETAIDRVYPKLTCAVCNTTRRHFWPGESYWCDGCGQSRGV